MAVFDDAGREYLDFIAGIGAVSLGHCHPALVDALADQAGKLVHVGNYYYVEHRGEVARMLSDLLNAGPQDAAGEEAAGGASPVGEEAAGGELPASPEGRPAPRGAWKTFFANSGAEANECAIKLARLHARKRAAARAAACGCDAQAAQDAAARLVVVLEGSFHGRTLATLAATAQPAKQEAFQPLPDGFAAVPQNDVARARGAVRAQGRRGVRRHGGVRAGGKRRAPVHGGVPAGGAPAHPPRRGALLVCDEIQCGVYRCGTHPFGFQHFGIVPDVVTVAKGVASGMPMGACCARAEVADAFEPGDHGSTFGGSCLAMAAAEATLCALFEEGIAERVERVGAYLRARLSTLPNVAEVRGLGLMVAADLAPEAPAAPDVVARGLDAGVLLNATGPRTLRFLPPLVCEERHVDALVEKLVAFCNF